ncbi:MAG: aldo/keto reductase, partial [Bacillota bacterium]
MDYRQLGESQLKVSVIGIGTWAIGSDFYGRVDDKQSIKALRQGMESGINLIDTAPAYGDGHSEEVVGKAIEGYRDRVIIATKCGTYRQGKDFIRDLKPSTIRKQLETSLSRLGVDTIDLYQIHWPDEDTPLSESVAELDKLKKEGKFRYLGVSNFDTELLSEIMEMTDIVSLQPQYSILNREIEDKILPFCRQHNLGIMAYGSLGGGILTGKYTDRNTPPQLDKDDRRTEFYPYFKQPYWEQVVDLVDLLKEIANKHSSPIAQVSLNWVRQQPGVTTALVGVKNEAQAKENAAAGDWKLSESELSSINEAYRRIFDK